MNLDKSKNQIKKKLLDIGVSEFYAEKQRGSSSHRSKISSPGSIVERAITFAGAIVIFFYFW